MERGGVVVDSMSMAVRFRGVLLCAGVGRVDTEEQLW